jgi:hypothetical protein
MTVLPDGTQKVERIEYPDGEKQFDVTSLHGEISKVDVPSI